eukprot:TRINITY_DN24652_c0_g1_i1.p1 TRINITY_DN24652_c0_g1~~TRINITY_DN24652_c0_g1_i1.p1  ORF type:complete len:909 (+),score=440.57 TRINITY_DN24652_c0_g1_i1:56-2728(+)
MSGMDVVHLMPGFFCHVTDQNTSATTLKTGPETFTKMEHEQIVTPPTPYIVVPPRHYCVVADPVAVDADGKAMMDEFGQAVVRIGESEVRRACAPFYLYPGERIEQQPRPLQVLAPNQANRVKALRDFVDKKDGKEVKRSAGDEWLEEGPATYYPHVFKDVMQTLKATQVGHNQALRLRAVNAHTDRLGERRTAGSEWLWTKFGPYLPSVDETVMEVVSAVVLTETNGVHVMCLQQFKDCFGRERKPGEEWLVTYEDASAYLPTPNEKIVREVALVVLNKRQYCIINDPYDPKTKQVQLGSRKLEVGPHKFFLKPGESLDGGCARDIYVLMADEALLIEALEQHVDKEGNTREAGDRWMVHGPRDYIPTTQVEVMESRRAIAMHDFEGVYVRDLKTGTVRAQMGPCSYMLESTEELWEKNLSPNVEALLQKGKSKPRDKTRVVMYSVPHNSVCQIFDYKKKTSRFVPGPDMLSLSPDEEFTIVSLSGGKPKKANVIKTLSLFLGPDFMTDNIRVETADHARLELQLSYNWRFEVDPRKEGDCKQLFSVADFVGDSCKAIASRVRGSCAGETFDDFHKNSSRIIRHAVFGSHDAFVANGTPIEAGLKIKTKTGETLVVEKVENCVVQAGGKVFSNPEDFVLVFGAEEHTVRREKWPNSELRFKNNGLVINNVDIQSVEPVDQKTKDSLIKSVQLAIHITTQGQEAQAKQRATKEEQMARGELESQLIKDKALSEKERKVLLALKAESTSIETTGAQRAEAVAASEAANVEAQSMVILAEKRAEAQKIQVKAEIDLEETKNAELLAYQQTIDELEITKSKALAKVEADKFGKIVGSMGKDTIQAIARAGPENQVRLLKALNLQGYMVTDGSSPINLFNAAKGMTGGPGDAAA